MGHWDRYGTDKKIMCPIPKSRNSNGKKENGTLGQIKCKTTPSVKLLILYKMGYKAVIVRVIRVFGKN